MTWCCGASVHLVWLLTSAVCHKCSDVCHVTHQLQAMHITGQSASMCKECKISTAKYAYLEHGKIARDTWFEQSYSQNALPLCLVR